MSKTTGIQWFVEPIGEYTNGIISEYLNQASTINESISVMGHTYRKKHINTFRIAREFALKLLESKNKDSSLKFRIFYSRFGGRKITLWKDSTVILNENKSKLKTVLELKDKIWQSEARMVKNTEDLIAELKKYGLNRKMGKNEKCVPTLEEISRISALLGKNSRELKNLFLKK